MNVPPLQTEQELLLVKRMLVLPVVLDVIEHDIKAMPSTGVKMVPVYVEMLKQVQDRAGLEMAAVRHELRLRGIRIVSTKRTSQRLCAEYRCRGYLHPFSMLWGVVKAEVQLLLVSYLGK